MNIWLLILIILTVTLGAAATYVAIIDARADRAHAKWMARNETNRERTRVNVAGISRGYRGDGLDGRADHPGALRKHTAP